MGGLQGDLCQNTVFAIINSKGTETYPWTTQTTHYHRGPHIRAKRLKSTSRQYYQCLENTSEKGDWLGWVKFF